MGTPRLAGHGPTSFAGLSKAIDLKLVSRLEWFRAEAMGEDRWVALNLATVSS